jgi:hypothetical protein
VAVSLFVAPQFPQLAQFCSGCLTVRGTTVPTVSTVLQWLSHSSPRSADPVQTDPLLHRTVAEGQGLRATVGNDGDGDDDDNDDDVINKG